MFDLFINRSLEWLLYSPPAKEFPTRGDIENTDVEDFETLADSSLQVSAASTFGQFGAVGNVAYCASKAAVIGLTRTAAKENQKIRVNCVSPGK